MHLCASHSACSCERAGRERRSVLASGLAPLRPELAAVEAGKILLHQMDHLTAQRASFAFETTLSAKNYLHRIVRWRKIGYDIRLVFLSLPTSLFAIQRVRQRVKQGGYNIPEEVIKRRFERGLRNLPEYKKLVNTWQVYDNSTDLSGLVDEGNNEGKES